MATYSIDTAEAIKHLKRHGFEEEQAEAIVHTFGRTQDDLVSKQDLELVIEKLRKDLTGEIQQVRTDLTSDIQKVQTNLNTAVGELSECITKTREDLSSQMSSQLKWIIGTVIGVAGLLLAAIALLVGGSG